MLTYSALSIDLMPHIRPGSVFEVIFFNLIESFPDFSVANLCLIPGIFLLYRTFLRKNISKKPAVLPSAIFAFSMPFGFSFSSIQSWNWVFGLKNGQFLKTMIIFCGYFFLFLNVNAFIYAKLQKTHDKIFTGPLTETSPLSKKRFESILQKLTSQKLFFILFSLLIIRFTPLAIISYPGLFMGDTQTQILEAFPELQTTISYNQGRMLSDSVYISQHHPVIHTLLLHWCILTGNRLFHSFNSGVFICVVLQAVFYSGAAALILTVLLKKHVIPPKYTAIPLFCLCLHPVIVNYMFLCTKDVFYTAFYLIFMLAFFLSLKGQNNVLLFACGMIGMLLFRNEARYLLPLVLIIAAFVFSEKRKTFITFAFASVMLSFLVFNVLFVKLNFTPGSIREALSVPFQQTARYVRDHGEEITDDEKKAIDAVLEFEKLASLYQPEISDPVKSTFREDASASDLRDYFFTWLKMLKKHPGTCLQASFNNYYQYFYPDNKLNNSIYFFYFSYSKAIMNKTNAEMESLDRSFEYPKNTDNFRQLVDKIRSAVRKLPIISLLLSPAFYVWTTILFINYSIFHKRKSAIAFMLLSAGIILVCLTGPCNGNTGRYLFPLIASLPFMIPMAIDLNNYTQ